MQLARCRARQSSSRESASSGASERAPEPRVSTAVAAGAAGACALVFALLWWRQTKTRDATSVDVAWSLAIGALGIGAALLCDGAAVQRVLAGSIAGVWSARLSWHLLRHRVLARAGEDGRYRAVRQHWGPRANVGFFCVYQGQAIAALVFAMPFWFVA